MKPADVSGMPKELEEVRRIALGEVPADEAQVRTALAQAWAWLAPLTSVLPSSGMSQCATEDVERWYRAVVARTKGSAETMMARMLRDGALEGAKVPVLVADNAALLSVVVADASVACEEPGGECGECGPRVARWVQRQPHPGAALLAEHEATVSALQAQVATLTAERAALHSKAGSLEARADEQREQLLDVQDAKRKAESERDTLREQYAQLVTDVRGLVDGHACITADGRACCSLCEGLVQVLDDHETSPSAPPTETKQGVHADRMCGACGGPLETSRDAVCETCTPEKDAHAIAASMTPAPEKFDPEMAAVKLAQDAGLPVRFTPIPERQESSAAAPAYRMMSALDVRPTVPPLLPVSERIQQSLAKLGHEPTPLTTTAADALHPSGRCTCAGEGTCAWCRARCDACGSPHVPEAVRHALAQVWSALHVTSAHQGVAVAILRAVYPELPVPNARAGADSLLVWNTLAQVVTEAARLGAEDMRARAAHLLETASIPLPFENWQGTKRELTAHFARALAVRIRDLQMPREEVARG